MFCTILCSQYVFCLCFYNYMSQSFMFAIHIWSFVCMRMLISLGKSFTYLIHFVTFLLYFCSNKVNNIYIQENRWKRRMLPKWLLSIKTYRYTKFYLNANSSFKVICRTMYICFSLWEHKNALHHCMKWRRSCLIYLQRMFKTG